MNHIYRSIWNEKTGTFAATSENASSAGKKASSPTGVAGAAHFALKALSASLMLALGANVYALPPTGKVTAGSATITNTVPGTLVINQNTGNVVINWQSFNIAAGETVQFVQPDSNSVALNRVTGADPSSILGNLNANGKVFLVNPNGILFGKGASVNVGGLVGSTLGISDQDFMAGRYQFNGDGAGAVVNQGAIGAAGGYVALLGGQVDNQGAISAHRGTVALAAGKAITLDVLGGQLLNVTVDQGALKALVQNGGLVQADGGQVLMTAHAAGSLIASVVNNTGVIRAQTVENHNGIIRLLGDPANGQVNAGGTLDASGRGAGQTGGQVTVLGQHVAVLGKVDVAGDAGGGTALIGGNYQGKGVEAHATSAVLGEGAGIDADAVRSGNGGKIVLWSSGDTTVNGALTARGGAAAGNGGLIETSGKRVTRGAGSTVNTLAPRGATGTWLLDPINYTIATTGGDETPAQVTLSLASTNRVITATNDITVADALTWTTAQTLELNAGHDVRVNATMTASTAGSGIKLVAGNDVALKAGAAITASANGSVIDMGAGNDIVIDGAVTADGGGSVRMSANNSIRINALVGADGGPVTLRADNDGTGPGMVGGTVIFTGTGGVSAPNTTILFNPNGYANTKTEIAAYSAKVVGALDARAWVFVQGNNKTYDGTRAATLSFRGTPSQGGDVTLAPGSATFNDKQVGVGKPIDYSGYSLGGADIATFALFDGGTGKTSGNITPLAIVGGIAAASKIYDGNNAATITSRTLAGVLAGDTVNYSGGSATFFDANVGDGKTVTGTGLGLGGADAGNYTVNTVAVTAANITPAPLTITALDVTKMYGQVPTLSAFTSTALVNGETIGSVTETSAGRAATAPVPGPYAIVPSAATGGTFTPSNYTITYVNGWLTVTPAPLTITALNATKVYGQTPTLSAFTSSALQNGETIGSVTETSAGTLPTAAVPGPYAIIPSAATGGTFTPSNYTINYVNGSLVVTPAPLTVTASNATKVYGETPVLTAFTSTALQNGETIGSVTATSAGTQADASAPGPYAIVASAATGGTFTPANYAITYVNGALTVSAAPPVTVPPVVVPPVVVPPVVVPPVVVPPVVVPPVVVPPVVVPPVVVPPVGVPPVAPVTVQAPPVVIPKASVPSPVSPAVVPLPVALVVVPPSSKRVEWLPETPVAAPPLATPPAATPPAPYVPRRYAPKPDRN